MGKVNPKFIGLSQYKAPFCYELAGKHFHIIMDDGRIHATGTHTQLLANDSIYQEIYASQMKGGDEDGFQTV